MLPSISPGSDLLADFQAEIRRGLAGEHSSIAMHPSFVGRPSGSEQGRFIVLDLGGTNVRATLLDMRGDGSVKALKSDGFRLPSTVGCSDDLFRPVARFVGEMLEDGTDYTLGFIFAFPIEQTGVRSGRLTKWTKEFAFSGVECEDVVRLLEDAVRRESDALSALRRLKIGALANDTVGVLAAAARLDSRCDMGSDCRHGHEPGCRAPIRHDLAKDVPDVSGAGGEMLFNMECGNFSGVKSVQTLHDRQAGRRVGYGWPASREDDLRSLSWRDRPTYRSAPGRRRARRIQWLAGREQRFPASPTLSRPSMFRTS